MAWISHTGSDDHAIAALAGRQHGVVSRRQLRELGLSNRSIDHRVELGRLHLLFRGVYAVGSSPRSSARNDARGAACSDGIPCTSPSRTLIDLAGSLGRISLGRMVEQAAVRRLLDIQDVDRVLARGRRRGTRQLREILVPWRGAERLGGECFEVDLLWDEQRLVIETDGEETHGTRAAFQQDRWRDQVLIAAGYRAARVTWRQLDGEPNAVVARIKRMLTVA